MKFSKSFFIAAGLLLALLVPAAVSAQPTGAGSEFLFATGLNRPTAAQTDWMKKNMPVVQKIKLNSIALDRINAERQKKGLKNLSENDVDVAPVGEESVFATSGGTSEETTTTTASTLPGTVDNSLSSAFPPIRSQGGIGSCAAWATTYYQFTYENNLARNRTASGGDNTVIFSPKWTYDIINGGQDGGAYFSDAYAVEMKNGAASWADFPYDTDYLRWPLDASTWRSAINYRTQNYGQISN